MAQRTTKKVAPKKTAPAAQPASAKPGTDAPAAKKEKPKRIMHPALNCDEDGKPTTPVDAVPEDFDSKVHMPLRRKDFSAEHLYFEMKAAECDRKAAEYRAAAEESKKMGSSKDRARIKRLKKMQAQMAALEAQLEAEGIDVSDIIGDDTDE